MQTAAENHCLLTRWYGPECFVVPKWCRNPYWKPFGFLKRMCSNYFMQNVYMSEASNFWGRCFIQHYAEFWDSFTRNVLQRFRAENSTHLLSDWHQKSCAKSAGGRWRMEDWRSRIGPCNYSLSIQGRSVFCWTASARRWWTVRFWSCFSGCSSNIGKVASWTGSLPPLCSCPSIWARNWWRRFRLWPRSPSTWPSTAQTNSVTVSEST